MSKVIEHIFYIVFVCLIATIFEILFFIYVIFPTQHIEINNYLQYQKRRFGQFFPIFINKKYLEIFSIRENKLNNKINFYIILIISIECLTLILILYIIKTRGNIKLKFALLSSFFTVITVALFQIQMYYFGKKFKYTGSYGQEELLALIYNKLDSC